MPWDVPEHHAVPVSGSRYERNTQNIPEFVRKMDLYIANIDKNDKIHG